MNKEALVKAVAKDSGLSQKDVNKVLASLENVMIETLQNGEEVRMVGFMSIKPIGRAARMGRNPADGSPVEIAEKVDVLIRPGKSLKSAVAELNYEDFAK
jgi:DNA-binding protein HU-beta